MALPIVRQGRLAGVLYLENNLATRVFTRERVRLLQLLSSQMATALENSRLFERLTEEERALRFLSEAGVALGESLEYQRTLSRVAELAVSWLADACVLYVMEGDEPRRVASTATDPAKLKGLDEVARLREPSGYDYVRQVVRSASPVYSPEVSPAQLERYITDPEARRILGELRMQSGISLPLSSRGRVIGVMTLILFSPNRRFNDRDLAIATELGRRAAAAIDNARLYEEKEAAVRARDEFLSIASHELKTPIASLRLMTEVFTDGTLIPGAAEHARAATVIDRQARRLQTLVDNLLDVSQIRTGHVRLHLEPVDLVQVVRQTLESWASEVARFRCEIRVASSSPGGGPLGPLPAGAGGRQPAVERAQVRSRKAGGDRRRAAGGRRPAGDDRSGHRHPGGGPAADLRALRAGGSLLPLRRHGSRPVHRQADRRSPARRRLHREHAGTGNPGHGGPAARPSHAGRRLMRTPMGLSPVAITNESMSREHFPDEDPIGINVTGDSDRWLRIVGVVRDVRQYDLQGDVSEQTYEPLAQNPLELLTFIVRTSGASAGLPAAIRPDMYEVDRDQPIATIRPLRALVDGAMARQRFARSLSSVFSATALLLAAIGIYG